MYLLQHAFPCEESKETGRVVIGWAWVGMVRQTQAGPYAPERLPGKLQAADKKEEQHLAFSERDQECHLGALKCKHFCSAFQ